MGLKEYLFGFKSENVAAKYLLSQGFEILEKNFHSKFGEIDIIAKKDDILHFIEVKSTSKDYETIYRVTQNKIYKIIKTINFYMLKYDFDLNYQIDIICIEQDKVKFVQNVSF
ncbi:YraN family protein [Campylobacter fetus]|uniref:YraN family protein n=1 Tax=Campylobacter fetus TaxID=196 RepID=UPI0003C27665|nr:YraN family protein [Campylobacter fetus]AGZ81188.1 putative protein (UPF0102 domain) [Campylobacter fetus subsp. testudinum 03-427]AJB44944.1 hypothetical protein CR44_01510 [Campylobacter fetus subsp. testudinum]EAI4321588.1 YraN family protein [Campylobacter fetus]EAI4391442.1 YraN family protein [Campylobacter fetus]EAK0826657.1 YraN family protein [Campylobacter fetus]